MHASNPSARLVSARPVAHPSAAAMSPNVAVCHTSAPTPASGDYNCDANDNLTTRHPHLAHLTPAQHQAIELILRGYADGAVAAKVGLSRRTILRWKHHHPAFIAELNFRQEQLLHQAALLYRRSLRKSFKIVNAIMKKPESPEALRIALALINGTTGRKVLNHEIGPTNPIAVVNAMAAEEERRHADVDPYVHQDMADRLAQLDQLAQAQETPDAH